MIYLESWFSWSRIDTGLQKNSWHVLFFSLFFSSFSFRARDWSTVIQLIKRLNRGNTWRRRPLFTLPHTKYRYTVCQKRVGPYVAPKFQISLSVRRIFERSILREIIENSIIYYIRLIKKLLKCLLRSPQLDFSTYFRKIIKT